MRKTMSSSSMTRSAPTLNSSQFELLNQIGTGSFGTVFRAVHKPTNKQCAIKRIDLESSDDDIEEIQKEIAILAECNDDHITRYYGCFMHEFELWIAMEYLGGGSCLDLMKDIRPQTMPESVVAEVIAYVVAGLAYLHGSGKIHRDIKAANVLIAENGDVKIADFGVAAQLSNSLSRRNTFVGTPFWMAPEVINQLDYSFEADIWSLGITAIELAHGKPPLSHLHPMKALLAIPRNPPPRLDSRFSAEFQDFVGQCLQMNPRDRPSITKLTTHPFLARRSRQELLHLMHQRPTPPPLPSSAATRINIGSGSGSGSGSDSGSSFGSGSDSGSGTITSSTPSSSNSASLAHLHISGQHPYPAHRRSHHHHNHPRSSQGTDTTLASVSESSNSSAASSVSSFISGKPSVSTAHGADRELSSDSQRTVYSVSPGMAGSSGGSDLDSMPKSATTLKTTAAHETEEEDDDDDWDFDTIKPQPSLEQILQNPPPSAELPPPVPPPSDKLRSPSRTLNVNTVDTLRDAEGYAPESNNLVRIFSHASRKFKDPLLDEISDMLRADPLTIDVENYLVRRIGRLAVQHFDMKTRDKPAARDAVEQILLDKWLEEVQEIHSASK